MHVWLSWCVVMPTLAAVLTLFVLVCVIVFVVMCMCVTVV